MAKVHVLAESADAQRALAAGARTIGDEVVLVALGAAETGVADKAYQVEVPAGAVADDAYPAVQGVFDAEAPAVVLIEPAAHVKTIGAKLAANLLTAAGADRVMTCDLHADQIQGFFDIPVDHVYASKVFIPYIQKMKIKDLSIAAPDMGGAKRANTYAKALTTKQNECGVIICHKTRARANVVAEIRAIGDVEGRNIIIVDDMIDTAGTLCKAADVLKEKGALSVRACATHGILSGEALKRIHESSLEEVFITDTIPHPELADDPKIKVVSMAPVFASIIDKVYNYEPISPEFIH
jgi:ribose-phosphate pyrophosphokinase